MKTTKKIKGINPDVAPSGTGCVECLKMAADGATGVWWMHLRRCAECGHVGCCDNSPNRHATKHFHTTAHPVIQSFEPGESWFYDYVAGNMIEPHVMLKAPHSHPATQSAPFYLP